VVDRTSREPRIAATLGSGEPAIRKKWVAIARERTRMSTDILTTRILSTRTIALAGATALATILAVSPAAATVIESGTVDPTVASAGNTSIPGTLTIGPAGTTGSVEVNNGSQLPTGTGNNPSSPSIIVGQGAGA